MGAKVAGLLRFWGLQVCGFGLVVLGLVLDLFCFWFGVFWKLCFRFAIWFGGIWVWCLAWFVGWWVAVGFRVVVADWCLGW